MYVLRSKVNSKLYSEAKTVFSLVGDKVEIIWDDDNPYKFKGEYPALLVKNIVDIGNEWKMVVEEV